MSFLLVWVTPEDPEILDAVHAEIAGRAGFHSVRVGPGSLIAKLLPLPRGGADAGELLVVAGEGFVQSADRAKADMIREALVAAGGNRQRAAHALGIDRRTIRNHMRRRPALFTEFVNPRGVNA